MNHYATTISRADVADHNDLLAEVAICLQGDTFQFLRHTEASLFDRA